MQDRRLHSWPTQRMPCMHASRYHSAATVSGFNNGADVAADDPCKWPPSKRNVCYAPRPRPPPLRGMHGRSAPWGGGRRGTGSAAASGGSRRGADDRNGLPSGDTEVCRGTPPDPLNPNLHFFTSQQQCWQTLPLGGSIVYPLIEYKTAQEMEVFLQPLFKFGLVHLQAHQCCTPD